VSDNKPSEQWRPVVGWSDTYEVSNAGNVRRVGASKTRALGTNNARYRNVTLCNKGTTRMVLVHRLVCIAFHGEPPPGHVVNHKNGNRSDNRAENLEWVTVSENCRHAMRNGHGVGERHSQAKLCAASVSLIRCLYSHGASQYDLAEWFGVHQANVHRVVTGKSWKAAA
jgi:hypothetical protein